MEIKTKFEAGDEVFVVQRDSDFINICGPVTICRVTIQGTEDFLPAEDSVQGNVTVGYAINQLHGNSFEEDWLAKDLAGASRLARKMLKE